MIERQLQNYDKNEVLDYTKTVLIMIHLLTKNLFILVIEI